MDPSTLNERLRGIVRAPVRPPGHETVERPAAEPVGSFEAALDGEWRSLPGGRVFVVERRMEPDESYGRSTVGDFASRIAESAREAALLTPGAPALPFVFFDLETTGLSGGAGSFAFLAGCGRFEADGGFLTRQYFLARPADERSMLAALEADLGVAGALVSFNGKSFDAPVLEARYALHRLTAEGLARPSHFDVLHPARRFWAVLEPGSGSCSLVSLEQQVLGVRRTGDVPGAEIPWRYFHFIRSGEAGPLGAVLEHNRLDLVSLAGLTARLLHVVAMGPGEARDAREMLGLGRVYARAGRDAQARETLERAVECASCPMVAMEARRCLALAARRSRRHEEAARHWHAILNIPGCPPQLVREASQALAVHHEHRVRDLGMARAYAERSLVTGQRRTWTDAARYRLARLDRKMASAPLLE